MTKSVSLVQVTVNFYKEGQQIDGIDGHQLWLIPPEETLVDNPAYKAGGAEEAMDTSALYSVFDAAIFQEQCVFSKDNAGVDVAAFGDGHGEYSCGIEAEVEALSVADLFEDFVEDFVKAASALRKKSFSGDALSMATGIVRFVAVMSTICSQSYEGEWDSQTYFDGILALNENKGLRDTGEKIFKIVSAMPEDLAGC
jgi:hypothetical protein